MSLTPEIKQLVSELSDYPEYNVIRRRVEQNGRETYEYKIQAYDTEWPLATRLSIELTAYRTNWQGNAYKHLKNAHDILWPEHIDTWNYWTERRYRALCDGHHTMTWAGGASCGKSFDAGKLAILFWLANPKGRTILVASTTLKDLDNRIWGYLKRFHHSAQESFGIPGHLRSSPVPAILNSKSKVDTIHGMFAIPLQKGTEEKTMSTLIGRHPDEAMLAIIDEGTDVSPGFMGAVSNWETAPHFQMIVIGNSNSKFDPHGLLSQPLDGWDSIDPDKDTEWPTKDGVCLYFDCYDSPAIHEPDEKKRELLGKFLYTEEGIEKAIDKYGEDSPRFYRFGRGFWPKDDALQTVLTPTMIDQYNVTGKTHWLGTGDKYLLAGLDPAFTAGGDNCILRFATLGQDINGVWVLDFGGEDNLFRIGINAKSSDEPEYQIIDQIKPICEDMGLSWENLAVDVHGSGTGLGAIITKYISPKVYKVNSAGPASKSYADYERKDIAKDVYDRRVTELWFSVRKLTQAGQIRGLDIKSCEQFCTREWDWKGRKYAIETKDQYKVRLGKVDNRYTSPDEADCATLIVDHARQLYGLVPHASVGDVARAPTLAEKYIAQTYGPNPDVSRDDKPFVHPMSWTDGFLNGD